MNLCKLVEEGGIGVRDLGEVQKELHMKIVWRMFAKENLWTTFFKAKYVK